MMSGSERRRPDAPAARSAGPAPVPDRGVAVRRERVRHRGSRGHRDAVRGRQRLPRHARATSRRAARPTRTAPSSTASTRSGRSGTPRRRSASPGSARPSSTSPTTRRSSCTSTTSRCCSRWPTSRSYERTLDFRDGVLPRDIIWRTPGGKRVQVTSTPDGVLPPAAPGDHDLRGHDARRRRPGGDLLADAQPAGRPRRVPRQGRGHGRRASTRARPRPSTTRVLEPQCPRRRTTGSSWATAATTPR